MPAERVRQHLKTHGVGYEVHEHATTYTAHEVAAAEHVPGANVAKSVLLQAGDDLVMAVLPATCKVDMIKARAVFGSEVHMAREDDFCAVFGDCEPGAEPPFGNLYGLRTFVDRRLTAEHITFNAGTHTEAMTIALTDYMGIVNPEVTDLAVDR